MTNDSKNFMKVRDTIPSNMIIDKYQKEIEIRQKYSSTANFRDKQFRHNFQSLVDKQHNIMRYNNEFDNLNIIWYRAKEFFNGFNYDVFRGITPTDIIQGKIDNCYLMSSIACLAEYPNLIKRIFDLEQANLYGVYSLLLNINGLWE